ncbi:conserved Plasmodium protein, unknown function [Plasmodium vivax]|uniref:Uncharacterized protein n=1 Tax=Plasmodium vivax TaxID=5855 RepID=A0A1G4HAD5_PLAVI|nr:conserved Plasmodium protein, unknown function [Plasmodium vivax]
MAENPNEEKETVRVTSCCWLSNRKIGSLNRNKNKGKDGSGGGTLIQVPNFNICLTSLSLPIIKLKNDLERISENKQIKRLRESRGGQKGRASASGSFNRKADAEAEMCQTFERCGTFERRGPKQGRPTNDDEVCSMLLRSKAFNETWRVLNSYMNCFVYNYVNEMVDREINFLNKNLCLREDKVSLLIVKTQTCPFVNLLQYRALAQKLKEVNGEAAGDRGDRGKAADGRDDGNTFTYKTVDNRVLTYTLLRKRRHISSCIVNVYTQDSVESILIRIIKKIYRKSFQKIDKNNMNEMFQKAVKRKREVLIIFIKNYIKLKSSIFTGLLLYLLHLKEINSISISVVITSNCTLSALSNLDYFVKKNVHVNICNLYVNYYRLIENIMFHPFFNNVLFKLKEYYAIIEHLFFLNHNMSFLQVKYFFYMFVRDFFDKKILSFLNIPLIYFCKLRKGAEHLRDPCPEGGEKYTKKFSTFQGEFSSYLSELHVGDLRQKFVLLLYASNFYEAHIGHLKSKGRHHTIYLMSEGGGSHTARGNTTCEDPQRGEGNPPSEQNDTPPMEKRKGQEKPTTGKGKNKRALPTEGESNHIGEMPHPTSKELSKKRKIKSDFFYSCVGYLNFAKSERGEESHQGGEHTTQRSGEKEGTMQNGVSPMWNHPNGRSNFPNGEKKTLHEVIQLMHRDSMRRTLKPSDHLRSCFFQNYTSRTNLADNLAECLSPMNRIMKKDFMEECDCLKVFVISNLVEHMKVEHSFDSLEVLKKEWKDNEYWKIQQYENVLARMERKSQSGKASSRRGERGGQKGGQRDGQRDGQRSSEGGEPLPRVALLYLHKCLAKSISKRMIALLYKKKKYNICLSIVNVILKNLPAYSSLRKRVHTLKELFKKYEQKFFIYNVKDLTKANEEIEKEFKQMLNAICDILINLYIGKINVLKKTLNEILTFLESVAYVIKLEKYLNERDFSGLNFETFVKKLHVLILFFDFSINLKKKKWENNPPANEQQRGNSHADRDFPFGGSNSYSPIATHDGEMHKMGTPLMCEGAHGKGGKADQHSDSTSVEQTNQSDYTQSSTNCTGMKTHLDGSPQGESENDKVEKLLITMSDSGMDLTLLEFVFTFFGELLYFLLMPCVFLLPLASTCIAHDHSPDAQDLLNKNLRMKLLHVLYHNKLELKDLNGPSCSGSSKFCPSNEANNCAVERSERGGDPQDLADQLAKKKAKGEVPLPCEVLQNGGQMEDMVIMFHIVQNLNARHLNVCSMFVQYVNVKLNLSGGGAESSGGGTGGDEGEGGAGGTGGHGKRRGSRRDRSSAIQGNPHRGRTPAREAANLHCESFQELFYNFVIATMSLFYYLKIIHIPSSFVKGKDEAQVSPSFSCRERGASSADKENRTIYANANGDSPSAQRDQKGARVLSTSGGGRPTTDEEAATHPMPHANGEADQKYKNYILDMLGSINIRRLIYGRGYAA